MAVTFCESEELLQDDNDDDDDKDDDDDGDDAVDEQDDGVVVVVVVMAVAVAEIPAIQPGSAVCNTDTAAAAFGCDSTIIFFNSL